MSWSERGGLYGELAPLTGCISDTSKSSELLVYSRYQRLSAFSKRKPNPSCLDNRGNLAAYPVRGVQVRQASGLTSQLRC